MITIPGVSAALSSASARPQYSSPPQLRDSISAVLRTLDSEPGPQRPRLVTKHDFMQVSCDWRRRVT